MLPVETEVLGSVFVRRPQRTRKGRVVKDLVRDLVTTHEGFGEGRVARVRPHAKDLVRDGVTSPESTLLSTGGNHPSLSQR